MEFVHIDCEKCIHHKPCAHDTDYHNYFGDCKLFKDKSHYDIIERAFNLLIYDVDMSSVDDSIFEKVFNEMCDKKCSDDKNCRDCIREYYIKRAKEENATEQQDKQ